MEITAGSIRNVLTRTSGYLTSVTSHSLQPYRGCSLGNSLCGVGCYVQHNPYLSRGKAWGAFLEVRHNAADSYRENFPRERRWARRHHGAFSIFLSSSTEPFPPQESRFGITRRVLEEMLLHPPDLLVLQTHRGEVARHADVLGKLHDRCRLRVHISIETDRERLPGLPLHGSPVQRRFEAARRLRREGIRTVITVSPLLPIRRPEAFFRRIAECADAVVLDHFIGGDGSAQGQRTRRTALPEAMAKTDPESVELSYLHRMAAVAERHLPGRVGIHIDGFAGRFRR